VVRLRPDFAAVPAFGAAVGAGVAIALSASAEAAQSDCLTCPPVVPRARQQLLAMLVF